MRPLALLLLTCPSLAFAATGTLRVEGPPAEILLDGFPTGQTAPATLSNVPEGEHTVELMHGCLRGEARVQVQPGALVEARPEMVEAGGQGTLFLRGLGGGAEVRVDGEPRDGAERGLPLPCGPHRVEVEAPGFEPWRQEVTVTTGQRAELSVSLEAQSFDLEPDPVVLRGEDEPPDEEPLDEEPLDAPPPRAPSALDLLDEPEAEEGGRRGRDREAPSGFGDDEDALDEGDFDALDDDGFDEDDFDEDDLDEDDLDDRRRDEDELDLGAPRAPSRPPKPPPPWRGLGVGAGATVGVVGLGLGAASTPAYATARDQYEGILAARGPGDPQTITFKTTILDPARGRMAGGYVLGVAGAGLATASWFLLPARDADLVVLPSPGGLTLSGAF